MPRTVGSLLRSRGCPAIDSDIFVNIITLCRVTLEQRRRSGSRICYCESGFPGFEAVPWFGLLAPTGTPQDVLDKLHEQTVEALAMPQVRKKLDDLGLEPVGNTPAEFTAIIKKETLEWAKVIKDAGIEL